MSKWVTFGLRQLFGGARRGQPGVAGLGAAVAIISYLRNRDKPKELLYKRNLKAGEEVRIRFLRGDTGDEISVSG